jgi:glycosyltransferase involved in cell wall biosynthesis
MTNSKKRQPNNPKVSVVCISYNQQNFISQTLEGFVMQKTNFEFEVIVADDYSTDQTSEIIRDYAKRFPNIIKPVLRKKNLGVHQNLFDALNQAKGRYIALCEGDDFWTSPEKLQKQADFLDKNQDYSVCFHPVKVFFEQSEEDDAIFPDPAEGNDFTISKLLHQNYIQTNSVMYRKKTYIDMPLEILPLDWYLHLYHAQDGKIGFINEVMASYRRHSDGIWWDGENNNQHKLWIKRANGYLGLFKELLKIFGQESSYTSIIESQIIDMMNRIIQADKELKTETLRELAPKYPDLFQFFVMKQNEAISHENQVIKEKDKTINTLSVSLSRAIENHDNFKKSRSFVLGYLLLHPWKFPSKLRSSIGKRVQKVKDKKDANKAEFTYADSVEILSRHINTENKKIAVILHLFYADLWDYFSEKLEIMDTKSYDLFVTVRENEERIKTIILEKFPNAVVIDVPNKGRDVLPFLIVANSIKGKGYEIFLKLHSKKSKHRDDGNTWMNNMVDSLLPKKKAALRQILETLDKENTAIVGPKNEYVSLSVNYEANKQHLRRLIKHYKTRKVSEHVDLSRFDYGFFAGTMFWAKFDALKPIISEKIKIGSFESEGGQIDQTLAHAYERLFCLIPELNDMKIYDADANGVGLVEYENGVIPQWSDLHQVSRFKKVRNRFIEK